MRDVEEYKPTGFIPVDVNENNATILVDGIAYLFETNMEKLVLGYYYRRRRIQERYDKLYGAKSRAKRKIVGKLGEKEKRSDIKWKIANMIVRTAHERRYAIVLEKLGKRVANSMIRRVKDKQLRHRVFQASFKGIQRAIEEKAGVPVIYVDPKNTSKLCPIHGSVITYSNRSRIGRCTTGDEKWHRDIVATWNIYLRAHPGDGSNAPSLGGYLLVDGSPVPLGSTAAHDPIGISKSLWARWKSLPQTQYAIE